MANLNRIGHFFAPWQAHLSEVRIIARVLPQVCQVDQLVQLDQLARLLSQRG